MKKLLLLILLIGIKQANAQTHHLKQTTFNKYPTNNTRLAAGNYQQTQSTISLLDSSKYWLWDTLAHVWKETGVTKNYTYDSQNRVTGFIDLSFNGTTLVNQSLYTATYINNVSTGINQSWNAHTNTWVNSYKNTITYDANNNITSSLNQSWDTTNSTWLNNYRTNCTYNTANKQTSFTDLQWSNNAWYKTDRYFYSFNSNNIETGGSYQLWDYTTHALTDSVKFSNTINATNDITNELDYEWDPYNLAWDTTQQTNFTYDTHHNQLTDTIRFWDPGFPAGYWVNEYESVLTYDANNNETSEIGHSWYNNAWFDDSHLFYTYDVNNNQLSKVHKNSTLHYTWVGDSLHNYYRTITAIPTFGAQNSTVKIYPNPAQNNFTIEVSTNEKQTVIVYDVNGKQVLSQTTQGTTNIDASNFNAGVYSISITSNQNAVNKKLIIVK